MPLFLNRTVAAVFATTAGGVQANLQPGLGFRNVQAGPGQHNVFMVLSVARGNGRQVHVFINPANGQITNVQMI